MPSPPHNAPPLRRPTSPRMTRTRVLQVTMAPRNALTGLSSMTDPRVRRTMGQLRQFRTLLVRRVNLVTVQQLPVKIRAAFALGPAGKRPPRVRRREPRLLALLRLWLPRLQPALVHIAALDSTPIRWTQVLAAMRPLGLRRPPTFCSHLPQPPTHTTSHPGHRRILQAVL